MDLKFKKIATEIGIALTGLVVVGAFGAAAFSDSGIETESNAVGLKNTKRSALAVSDSDEDIETEQVNFINFMKASIDEYDMSVKTKKISDDEEDKEVDKFSVELPEDHTQIYDSMPDAMNYNETRSTADEYYTVYDEISGKTVTLNGHEIVCQIVYSEINSGWKEDAIKAQAVAAYSYLRFHDMIGQKPSVGLKAGYPSKIDSCVSAVEGQAVYYDNSIINAVYSASSAGYSTESGKIWNVTYPYLRAVVSAYDEEDPHYGVKKEFSKEQVKDIFKNKADIELSDDIQNWFKIDSRFSDKYIENMTIDGQHKMTGNKIVSLFGLKSNAFTIDYENGTFTFTTYGWGHGVGMSQWGACLYANHGYTYDQILRHYYLDTYLKVSDVNQKAVERGEQYKKELEEESSGAEDSSSEENEESSLNADSKVEQADSSSEQSKPESDSSSTDDGSSSGDSEGYSDANSNEDQ